MAVHRWRCEAGVAAGRRDGWWRGPGKGCGRHHPTTRLVGVAAARRLGLVVTGRQGTHLHAGLAEQVVGGTAPFHRPEGKMSSKRLVEANHTADVTDGLGSKHESEKGEVIEMLRI